MRPMDTSQMDHENADDKEHMKDFELKWKQKNLNPALFNKRDFRSTVSLRNQISSIDVIAN